MELMVVISVALLMVAMTMPVARSMTNGNRAMGCITKMQALGRSLRSYDLDYGSVPPYYPDLSSGTMVGTGLLALVDGGYINGEMNLHCPADRHHPTGDPLYPYSYCAQDSTAAYDSSTSYGAWNQLKYMTSRGLVRGSGDPDERRQLAPLASATTGRPAFSREWHPDDSTIVLWCDFHYDTIEEAGQGQYQVLFWDGSAQRVPASLMCDGLTVAEAWRVTPDDDPTP